MALTVAQADAQLRDRVLRQLVAAAEAIKRLYGMRGISNEIVVTERAAWANPGVARVESRLEVTSRRWW